MHAIQENEIAQLRDLTGLMNLEFHFVESYLEVLKGVRDEWVNEYVVSFGMSQGCIMISVFQRYHKTNGAREVSTDTSALNLNLIRS